MEVLIESSAIATLPATNQTIRMLVQLGVLTVALLATGCTAKKPMGTDQAAVPRGVVGADRDAHGCIGSAGYTFSQNRNKCIRLFEDGMRLDPKDASLNQSVSAFVVLKEGGNAAAPELFLPGSEPLLPIRAAGRAEARDRWTYKQYKLSRQKGIYTLIGESGTILYQGPSAP